MSIMTAPAVTSGSARPGGGDIDVSAVSKVFRSRDGGQTNALANTSFKIQPGAFVSLVGPSGCGKSTLLRMIAGLIPPTRGAVLLGGTVVSEPSPEIGIAFQRPVLLPWLTVRGNIALPAELDGHRSKADIAAKVDALLEMVRLPGSGERMPGELSGGMQQRVAIARALMSDPGVLLMDEPFGALDAMTREHLNDELLEIWARDRPTVVFVTHDIPEAVYLSDRVLVMAAHPGRVIADIVVPLPRPRDATTRLHPEFARLGAEIRALIAH
jgi:NitT/TauT family transport system ATP-binding protein